MGIFQKKFDKNNNYVPNSILYFSRSSKSNQTYCETYQIIIDLKIIFENFRILELRELFRETETIIIC